MSPRAIEYIAKLKGEKCFFFVKNIGERSESGYISVSLEEASKNNIFYAFSIPNPKKVSELYDNYDLCKKFVRNDPDLVRCVEELGEKAAGKCAKLRVVEIPDGTEFLVKEYDGMEHIAEKHRTWG